MRDEHQLSHLIRYVNKTYKSPKHNLKMLLTNDLVSLWYRRSYQHWAAEEIISELLKNDFNPRLTLAEKLESIRQRYNEWSLKPHPSSHIFSIAYEVATDLLDQIL